MKLRVHHRTEYLYAQPARNNSNELRLQPLDNEWQQRRFHVLRVLPSARMRRFADFHANGVHHFEVEEAHDRLVIEVESVVQTHNRYSSGAPLGATMSTLEETGRTDEAHMFLQESRYVQVTPEIWRAAVDAHGEQDDVFSVAETIMKWVHGRSTYKSGVTTVGTTSIEFFAAPTGVCQDYTHLMIALCRSLKIPARYVSGYLFESTPGEMRGAQASDAWCEVFVPGHGWHGMDPTNDRLVDEHYISLATGRDYDDVAPVKGTFFGGGHRRMLVVVNVEED